MSVSRSLSLPRQRRKEYGLKWYNDNKNYHIKRYNENEEQILKYQKEYNIKRGHSTGTGQSIHEKEIEKYLIENDIKYESEKTFNDCLSPKNNKLPFDFYLQDYNLIIEFDGQHHFKPIWSNFETIKLHDKIKNEYCRNNKIELIRISYLEQNNLKQILQERINKWLI